MMQSIGDMAQALVLRQQQANLQRDLNERAVEVSTGLVYDAPAHLAGDVTTLMALDRSLAQLEAYRSTTTEAALITGAMQTALDQMQDRTQNLSQVLVTADLVDTPGLYETFSTEAVAGLGSLMSELNTTVAGRFLFSGTATDTPAVTDAESLLAEIRPLVAAETTLAGIEAQLDAWFDTPGGGFETQTYTGATDNLSPFALSDTESANVDIRADATVFRDLMKGLTLAALANDSALTLDPSVQSDMLSTAGRDLQRAQEALVDLRAGLGTLEARIEETKTRNGAERTATSLAKLDLVGVDAYEAASAYQNAQGLLESLYAITARSSQLSLTSFLR